MPSTLESCEEFFGTKDLYEILAIVRNATEAESITKAVKKAYYKKALLVHPDRVPEDEKAQATDKFKILTKVNQVLSGDSSRALYDEQGIIDDDDDGSFSSYNIVDLNKFISDADIEDFRGTYVGSELEKSDLKKSYVDGRGCFKYLMERMPFMRAEDEPRFHEHVNEWIKNNEVEDFPAFTSEPEAERARRHKKYSEDEQIDGNGPANQNRSANFGSFMDKMKKNIEKYFQKEKQSTSSKKRTRDQGKNPIKAGRVSKRNK